MTIIEKKKELDKAIKNAKNIFIMGHKYLDLDAIGSAIGICEYVQSFNKSATIVINDRKKESGVKKILDKIGENYRIYNSKKVENEVTDKSLIIIVDTNKEYLVQDENFFLLFKNKVVIDHHDFKESSIKDGLLIIDEETSSTCEMITDLLDISNVKVGKDVATAILSGIVLDTSGYTLKTRDNTYKASYLLTKQGASTKDVQYLLKQNIKEYIARQKVLTNIKIYKKVAITAANRVVRYRREDLAKIADTLLQFSNIETSFVIGKLDKKTIGISARSIGNLNVGNILEKLGGGGDEHEAGARIENSSIQSVKQELKNVLKNVW